MRYIIAAATAFTLVAGIALGVLVSSGLDGSASAAPRPPEGRLIELGTLNGSAVFFPFVDVSDCGQVTMMAAAPSGSAIGLGADGSPDGTTLVPVSLQITGKVQEVVAGGIATASIHGLDVTLPFMRVRAGGSQAADITAWIWCTP